MPLPRKLDGRIRNRFNELIADGRKLLEHADLKHSKGKKLIGASVNLLSYSSFHTSATNLIHMVLDEQRYRDTLESIREVEEHEDYKYLKHYAAVHKIVGILVGLRKEYASGLLDDLSRMIEATVSYDFMGQAEQLLDGGKPEYDHVPAAVLAGAVLENGLRRLCQRQSPPIETKWDNGKPKRLNALIDELQGKAFKPAKADQLRSWTKIRNSVGHGDIDEFSRADVEDMIASIKRFLAEYDL